VSSIQRKTLIKFSLALFATLSIATAVQARTVSATSGTALNANQVTCFGVSFIPGTAGVTNACAGTAFFVIPLTIDNPGSRTFTVTGRVDAGGSMSCQLLTFTQVGGQATFSPTQAWPANGTHVTRSFANVNVPANGTGFVLCQMSGGSLARVHVVGYLPS
jgi:hypothetical protein